MLAETREREPIFAFQDERHTCLGRVARVCKERSRVHLNLSLDGPEYLHDRRMRSRRGTHALACRPCGVCVRARRNVHIVDGIATDLERGSALVRPLDAARSGA